MSSILINKIFTNSLENGGKMESINEVAFEKSRELKHVEKLIDRLKRIKDPDTWNESPIKTEIEKILAGFFGFKALQLYIVYDIDLFNKRLIQKTPDNPYPTNPNAVAVMMYQQSKNNIIGNYRLGDIKLRSKKKFDPTKITNISKHRNISVIKSKDRDEFYYPTKLKPGSLILYDKKAPLIPASKKDEFFTITKKGYRVNADVYPLVPTICITYSLIQKSSAKSIIATLLHEIGHLFNTIHQSPDTLHTRLDEINADKFATAYGYGDTFSDFITTDMKMNSQIVQNAHKLFSNPGWEGDWYRNSLNQLHPELDFADPKIQIAYFKDRIYQTDFVDLDEHPRFARLVYQMDQIREDLKHEKNPKIQNRLIHNLKRIRDTFKAFKSDPNNKLSTQTIQAEIISCNQLLGQYTKLLNPAQHNKSLKKYQV